jgi:uncharacterized protein DUF6166
MMGPECVTCPRPARAHHMTGHPSIINPTEVSASWHRLYGTDVDATGTLLDVTGTLLRSGGLRARLLTPAQIEQWAARLVSHLTGSAPEPVRCGTEFTPSGAVMILGDPDAVVAPGQVVEAVVTDAGVWFRPGPDPRAHDVYYGRREFDRVDIAVLRPQLNAVGEPFAWHHLGDLPHRVRHSPTGMAWGFSGAGPADLARSLLLHAVDNPRCAECAGTRYVVDLDRGGERTRALDPYAEDLYTPGLTGGPCPKCEDGTARVPYQRFKHQIVTNWDDQWRITRAELLAWLAANAPTDAP